LIAQGEDEMETMEDYIKKYAPKEWGNMWKYIEPLGKSPNVSSSLRRMDFASTLYGWEDCCHGIMLLDCILKNNYDAEVCLFREKELNRLIYIANSLSWRWKIICAKGKTYKRR
jgi:hypothetical protein